jgi:hypothetical protein
MLIFLKVLMFIFVPIQVFSTIQLYRYEKRKRIFRIPAPCMLSDGSLGTKLTFYMQEGPGNKQRRIRWFCSTMLSGAAVILCMTLYQYLS